MPYRSERQGGEQEAESRLARVRLCARTMVPTGPPNLDDTAIPLAWS